MASGTKDTIKEISTWICSTTDQRQEVTAALEDSLIPWNRYSRPPTSRGRSELTQTPQEEFVRKFGTAVVGHGGNPYELLNQSIDACHEVLDQVLLRLVSTVHLSKHEEKRRDLRWVFNERSREG